MIEDIDSARIIFISSFKRDLRSEIERAVARFFIQIAEFAEFSLAGGVRKGIRQMIDHFPITRERGSSSGFY